MYLKIPPVCDAKNAETMASFFTANCYIERVNDEETRILRCSGRDCQKVDDHILEYWACVIAP